MGDLPHVVLLGEGRANQPDDRAAVGEDSDTRRALVWLAVRRYVGYAWIEAGFHMIQEAAWVRLGGMPSA